ncbi:MAG: tRNA (adenosine(37)-N6)-threonylcarbamoyltransferase complex transferase subunit TsaD [Candidatus Sericytochromatia bacterium]|nr:tRNA (adenosine(37)-N6)-threonylcarbamoyltransferase complex transferase subunit TsaD [Candidatus Sericytochromatia bacterium]
MIVLGLESSCDETSLALVGEDGRILANLVASQADMHARYGGVVPEMASRRHVESLGHLLDEVLAEAGVGWDDLGGVAATRGPGLAGALLVGLMAGKAVAFARGLPFVGVHHLAAHVWANVAADPRTPLPFLCLLVSGGHTTLVRVEGAGHMRELGRTRDDAAGEAYDKVGRLLGLGYPGGPAVDRLGRTGNPAAFAFPRARLDQPRDFSFSGLKTAVRRVVEGWDPRREGPLAVADLCASFQEAVVDVLVDRTVRVAGEEGLAHVTLAGGVAANRSLRERMAGACAERGLTFACPPPELCTDNAAMVAALGRAWLLAGRRDAWDAAPRTRWSLDLGGDA